MTFMNVTDFVDTNILVYAYDVDASSKHRLAKELIGDLWESRNGILSTQVLCEFFVTVTRKIPNPLSIDQAQKIIGDYAFSWYITIITPDIIQIAINAMKRYNLSFGDALIWSSAKYSGAGRIYTEDLQHGMKIDGIEFVNPFLL
jgi:predicted nucleic acid-binding protein